MYTIVNTYPKLAEEASAEIRSAAARAIHTILAQYIKELSE